MILETGNQERHNILEIKLINSNNFTRDSLKGFRRYQEVKNVYRLQNGNLTLVYNPFTEDWDAARLIEKAEEILSGQYVTYCAYEGNHVVGEIMLIPKRLLLRPFRESDYDDLFEFLSQLADDEFEGYPGIIYENGQEHLKYRLGSEEFYAIELTESGKVIGNIYCGNKDLAAKEVGYIVNKRYQKKGYATEALSAVIAQVFREGAHRVFAECDPRNVPSWKLLEKVGLRREAHFRQNIWFRWNEVSCHRRSRLI